MNSKIPQKQVICYENPTALIPTCFFGF